MDEASFISTLKITDETTLMPPTTEYTTGETLKTTVTEDERFENARALSGVDIGLVVVYLLISLGVGLWVSGLFYFHSRPIY